MQVVVGCKQDLERVDLPYVEIEAMVTITNYSTTLTLLILRLAWIGSADTLNVVALMEMGSLEFSGKQIFIFCHIVNFLRALVEGLEIFDVLHRNAATPPPFMKLIKSQMKKSSLWFRELSHQAGVRAPEALASSRRQWK